MADILYRYNKQVYFNITNRCCCNCTFCIRNHQDYYGEHAHYPFRIRLNTNGLADLIHNRSTAEEICSAVDSISISLNMPDAKSYTEIVHPVYGEKAFDAMLQFAKDCKKYLGDCVRLSVVNVIGEENIEKSKLLAKSLGISLRIREYS